MANPITQIILTAVDRTKAAFASVTGGMKTLGSVAGSLKGLLGSIFTGFAVLRFVAGMKSAVDQMDEANKSAQKLGTSVENFTALKFAAGQAGVGVEDLSTAMAKLARSLDDAKSGSLIAKESFERLKIDPNAFKDPADALLVLADRFKSMPDGVNKTALAMNIFGKAGARLIPFLNQGRDGIEALKEEAKKLGVVISTETAIQAEKFNDNMDRLSKAANGLGYALATEALGPLGDIAEAMAEAAKQGGLTAAAFALIKEVNPFIDYLKNENLDPIRRLAKAEQELIDLRKDGFAEDHKRVVQLKEWIPLIKVLSDQEHAAAEQKKKDQDTSDEFAKNKKLETEAFKKATNEQIADAERLKTATREAWRDALAQEKDYLAQAKKLRAEANAVPNDGSVEGKAGSKIDALSAAMKLQRTAGTDTLENVQANAEALRLMSANLEDAALKSDLLKLANETEAKALEKAAKESAANAEALNKQSNEAERRAANMNGALEGIGKEVSVDIKTLPSVEKTKQDLSDIVHLIETIKAAGPIQAGVNVPGAAATSASLKTAALQYGRRP